MVKCSVCFLGDLAFPEAWMPSLPLFLSISFMCRLITKSNEISDREQVNPKLSEGQDEGFGGREIPHRIRSQTPGIHHVTEWEPTRMHLLKETWAWARCFRGKGVHVCLVLQQGRKIVGKYINPVELGDEVSFGYQVNRHLLVICRAPGSCIRLWGTHLNQMEQY